MIAALVQGVGEFFRWCGRVDDSLTFEPPRAGREFVADLYEAYYDTLFAGHAGAAELARMKAEADLANAAWWLGLDPSECIGCGPLRGTAC